MGWYGDCVKALKKQINYTVENQIKSEKTLISFKSIFLNLVLSLMTADNGFSGSIDYECFLSYVCAHARTHTHTHTHRVSAELSLIIQWCPA